MNPRIDRLVTGLARDPGPGLTPGARELLNEITRIPAPRPVAKVRRRWRGAWAMVPAMFTVILAWALTAPAQAALDIRRDGAFFTVVVNDPHASPSVYREELRAAGLAIRIVTAPASPGRVGSVTMLRESILRTIVTGGSTPAPGFGDVAGSELPWDSGSAGAIQPLGSCEPGEACLLGIRVSAENRAATVIQLGRPAEPGETYVVTSRLDETGELLHCVPFVNRRVSEVRSLIAERGVRTIKWVDHRTRKELPSPPGFWYVREGWPYSDDTVVLYVGPSPSSATDACAGPANI
ncbi:hypothetical protein [Acrocarpospora catenulata]|uniref:hypothetical protein n=1 Tax=Acrocarpospora catenulata TaxID=2836182 RepID=UPI001BDAA11C|nr:hypothetical protein [Acrocarpospora catenulata]